MRLYEIFNNNTEITWDNRNYDQPIAFFVVKDVEYHVIFQHLLKNDIWVVFYDIDRPLGDDRDYEPTGTMGTSGPMVLSGVVSAIQEFLADREPEIVAFDGSKSAKLGPLYAVIAKRLSGRIASLGYSIDSSENDYANKFKITRNAPLGETK